MAEQVSAAQQVFELAEKDLDGPTVGIEECDDFGRNIEQIRGDSQEPVTVRTRGSAVIFSLRGVRFHLDDHQSYRMLRSVFRGAILANLDDLIREDLHRAVCIRQRPLFGDLVLTVVADSTDVTGLLMDDVPIEYKSNIDRNSGIPPGCKCLFWIASGGVADAQPPANRLNAFFIRIYEFSDNMTMDGMSAADVFSAWPTAGPIFV